MKRDRVGVWVAFVVFGLCAIAWAQVPDLESLGGPILPFVFASGMLWQLREPR